jgi:hypothetical protein
MKTLRKFIRQIILEKGELRRSWSPPGKSPAYDYTTSEERQEDVDLKEFFRQNADQSSLKKLRYVHWGTAAEISRLLRSSKKNEINTAIHAPNQTLTPWNYDEQYDDTKTVGLLVTGWVTFASNVDLDSQRLGDYFEKLEKEKTKGYSNIYWPQNKDLKARAKKQAATSGVPKRPDASSLKSRVEKQRVVKKKEAGKILTDEEDQIYQALVDDNELRTILSVPGRDISKIEDLFILNAEDFVQRTAVELEYEIAVSTLNWPEAILDNWKPVAIIAEDMMSAGDLLWEHLDWEIPILDLDLNVDYDFYVEELNARCEDWEYDDYETAPEGAQAACENGLPEEIYPWLEKWV